MKEKEKLSQSLRAAASCDSHPPAVVALAPSPCLTSQDASTPLDAASSTRSKQQRSKEKKAKSVSTSMHQFSTIVKNTPRPRVWRKSLGNAWHATVSKLPATLPLRFQVAKDDRKNQEGEMMMGSSNKMHSTGGTTTESNNTKRHVSSSFKESFQSGVHHVVVQPFQSVTASIKKSQLLPRIRCDSQQTAPIQQPSRHSNKPRGARPILARYTSVMDMSARKVNNALSSPIYQQSRWELWTVLFSYCTEWLEGAGLSVVGFLLFPTFILLSWWNYFVVDTRPVLLVQKWWYWCVHLLQTGRRQAQDGTPVHTSRIVAAGVALAIYNSAMTQPTPTSTPPASSRTRRRSKRIKRYE